MALIKSSQAKDLAHEAIVLDLGDLRRQAQEILQRAEVEADQILVEARRRGVQLANDAEAKGYEEGYAKGEAEGQAAGRESGHAEALAQTRLAIEAVEQRWIAAVAEWEADRQTMIHETRRSIIQLALAVAEQVVGRVAEQEPERIVDRFMEAVAYLTEPCDVTVRLNPEDKPLLTEAMPRLLDQATHARHVELIEDRDVERGGCVLVHGRGRVDAQLQTKITRLAEALVPQDAAEDSAADEADTESEA